MITELVYDPSTTSLSCTSNGGPVTSLTWTQDQLPLGSEVATSYQTVADISSAQYLNILQLSREGERGNVGTYECRVSNVRGNDSRELRVVGKLLIQYYILKVVFIGTGTKSRWSLLIERVSF